MKFEFEKFQYTGGSYEPKISVRSNGALGFTQGALRRFKLWDGDWFMELHFDRKHQVIGIRPSHENGSGRASLVKKFVEGTDGRQSVNAFVAAKSFFDYYGLDYSKSRSYLATWDDEEKMIIIQLSDETPAAKDEPEQNEGGPPT